MQAALAKGRTRSRNRRRACSCRGGAPLGVPSHTIGESVGVAKNSKGHLFVFTRIGNVGPAKGATASQLFEFDPALSS